MAEEATTTAKVGTYRILYPEICETEITVEATSIVEAWKKVQNGEGKRGDTAFVKKAEPSPETPVKVETPTGEKVEVTSKKIEDVRPAATVAATAKPVTTPAPATKTPETTTMTPPATATNKMLTTLTDAGKHMLDASKGDLQKAALRVGAQNAMRLLRAPICGIVQNAMFPGKPEMKEAILAYFQSPIGQSIFKWLLGMLMMPIAAKMGTKERQIAMAAIAEELRIDGWTSGINEFVAPFVEMGATIVESFLAGDLTAIADTTVVTPAGALSPAEAAKAAMLELQDTGLQQKLGALADQVLEQVEIPVAVAAEAG